MSMKLLFLSSLVALAGCSFPKQSGSSTEQTRIVDNFFDDFSDNRNGWNVTDDNEVKMSFYWSKAEDFYIIENKTTSVGFNSSIPVAFTPGHELSAQVRHYAGDTNRPFGIVFGDRVNIGYCWFYISETGYYGFQKLTNGNPEFLVTWTQSSYINQDEDNTLGVRWQNGEWGLYINEHLVNTLKASSVPMKRIGFRIEGMQTMRCIDIKIAKL